MNTQAALHSIDGMLDRAAAAEIVHINSSLPVAERARGKRVANLCFKRALRLEGNDPGKKYEVLP